MKEILDRFFVMLVCHFPRLKKEGQGLVEYALILVLIAIVCIVVLQILGRGTSNALSTVGSAMTSAPVGGAGS